MDIVQYPHPTLRHKSSTIKRVDADLKAMIRQMFDLMYEARGVGLAANQVDLPVRLFVVNTEADPEAGEELVFINPIISRPRGMDEAEEGCLSIPGVYAPVSRPKQIRINAYNLQGQEINQDVDGLLARVIQHETDHLDGVLFLDHLDEEHVVATSGAVGEFELNFAKRRERGDIPSDEDIAARLKDLESRYC